MEEKKKLQLSLGMFNLPRGILMIAIILCHSVNMFFEYWNLDFQHWWYIFFVPFKLLIYGLIPMFFMMSGYGFREKKIKKSLQDAGKLLWHSYVWVAVLVCGLGFLKATITGDGIKEALKLYAFPFLFGVCPGNGMLFDRYYVGTIGPIWFVMAMTISTVIFNLVIKIKTDQARILVILLLTGIPVYFDFQTIIPFCVLQALCCISYLYIGYDMKKSKMLSQEMHKTDFWALVLVLAITIPFGFVDISQNVYRLGYWDYIGSVIAGVLLLRYMVRSAEFSGKVSNYVRKIGKNSLDILCVHTVEFQIMPWKEIAHRVSENMVMDIALVFVLRLCLIWIGVKILHFVRSNMRKLGRR